MRRWFQFSLKTLLIATFGVACFFGGMSLQLRLDKPVMLARTPAQSISAKKGNQTGWKETIKLPDGTEWERLNTDGVPQEDDRAWTWMREAAQVAQFPGE